MPFAALHQLCAPMLGDLASLPTPQQQALRVAFGLAAGNPPDRFMVGLAALGLVAEVAAKRPLVCLIDDAQWLDEASSQVLAFVGRRLLAEPILLLLSVREADDERVFPVLPTLTLEGLIEEDARALLRAAVPGHLDQKVRDRIVAETGGNPLALLELPRGMSPAELAGGFGVPRPDSVPGHIEKHYARRVRALAEPTQRLILLAAADPTGDATLLWAAAQTLGVPRAAAMAAESEQLLEIGPRVRFRHPLVRSAVYAAAAPEDRRAAHLALADATDAQVDPQRRVWHLASAAAGPDEAVASALERTAGTVQARAGLASAAALLQRALELTADPARRPERALSAAQAHLHAGAFHAARGLSAEAAGIAIDDLQRARAEQLTGQIEAAARPSGEAPVRLLQAARRLESLDVRLARETYLQAFWAAVLAGRLAASGGDLLDVAKAARSAPPAADPRPCDLLLDGLATAITEGRASAAPTLRSAIDLYRTGQVSDDDWIQWGRSAATAAFALWDMDSLAELSTRQVELARSSGALNSLVLALNFHGLIKTCCGELEEATAVVAEENAVREVTGIRMVSYAARLVAAYQGRPADLPPEVAAVENELMPSGDRYVIPVASLATAVLNNGLCRYTEAVSAARDPARDVAFLAPLALSELIEAATRIGRTDLAQEALGRLSTLTVDDSDWARGIEARGRAMVSVGPSCRALIYGVNRLSRPHTTATRARPIPSSIRRVASP